MKKPFIKKIVSNFREVKLEETGSIHNPTLFVLLYKGRYQLCTQTAIYSYEDKYDNFRTAFDQIRVTEKKLDNVLLLGLGLGSIPYMLEKIYEVDTEYVAVEIDEVICQLAEKYVLSDLKSNIQIYPIDALNYFQWYDHKYDMIAMDIFQSAEVPSEFESLDYFETIKSRINEGGTILYNRLSNTSEDVQKNRIFGENWLRVFPQGGPIDCKNNLIFINDLELIPK